MLLRVEIWTPRCSSSQKPFSYKPTTKCRNTNNLSLAINEIQETKSNTISFFRIVR